MTDEHVHIAVVGGGIAGLYCCFHLAARGSQPDRTLALCEASKRLGGKIETWRIDPKKIDRQPPEPIRILQLIEENRDWQ